MESKRTIAIDEQRLTLANPEIDGLLRRLHFCEAALAREFDVLARSPAGYGLARAELDTLDGERRSLLYRLGELAAAVFLVAADAPSSSAEIVEVALGGEALIAEPAIETGPETAREPKQAPRPEPKPIVKATAEQLDAFKAAFGATAVSLSSAARVDDRTVLHGLAHHVKIAERIPTDLALYEEIDQIERATSEARQQQWRVMGGEGQVRWITILVAWAKALEIDARRLGAPTGRLAAIFRELRGYSIEHNPGFIHGFARNAEPKHGDWRASAIHLLDELRARQAPISAPPRSEAKAKDESARDESPKDESEEREEEARDDKLPSDWPYLEQVKGREVVMLGGDVREERRVALERVFQFASLDWIPHHRPRLIESLAERATRGSVDFILFNKFVSHKDTIAIGRSAKTPLLALRHGYGVTAVQLAFEEYFSRQSSR